MSQFEAHCNLSHVISALRMVIRTVTCRQFPNLTFAPRKTYHIFGSNLTFHSYQCHSKSKNNIHFMGMQEFFQENCTFLNTIYNPIHLSSIYSVKIVKEHYLQHFHYITYARKHIHTNHAQNFYCTNHNIDNRHFLRPPQHLFPKHKVNGLKQQNRP